MLKEEEIANWLRREKERISCLVDPTEKKIAKVVIATLEGILDE